MKKIILIFTFAVFVFSGYSQNNVYVQRDNHSTISTKKDTVLYNDNERQDTLKEKRHELSVWVGGGYSSLRYKPTVGDYKYGLGGQFGIGYTYLFKPKWGISTGAELEIYNAQTTIVNHSDRYRAIDDENQYNQMTLLVDKFDDFEETQRAYYLNIPIMLQYQNNGEEDNKFYAALGVKIGIPIQCKYKSTGDYLTKGQYDFTQTVFEDMPEHGYNFYDDLKANEKLKLNLNFQLSGELGYKWCMNEDWFLYTGVYCDYGLNDIRKTKDNPYHVLQYNRDNPIKYTINSITESQYTNDKGTYNYIKKINTLSFGVKLKIAFKLD